MFKDYIDVEACTTSNHTVHLSNERQRVSSCAIIKKKCMVSFLKKNNIYNDIDNLNP